VFKTWQIFVFSLVPLALVFAGVIIGSMDGIDAERQVFPTPAPQSETSAPPPTPSAPGETIIQLSASNLAYDQRALTAAPGPVTVQFDNKDGGVLHNFALYTDSSASQKIFSGDLATGPVVVTYSFDAPGPGTYYFRCDVHPDTMNGSFTVK
jgi:plastocyanin